MFAVRDIIKCFVLVIIGATKDDRKELVAISDGYKESEIFCEGILVDLKNRGSKNGAKPAIGDGSFGF